MSHPIISTLIVSCFSLTSIYVSHFPFLPLSWVILSVLCPCLSLSLHIFFLTLPLLSRPQALSGDSTINPSLGRLVLQCLCPALHSLLTNGLKPHQSDLIAGRRPNSTWGLVQASTRPGSTSRLVGKWAFIDLDIKDFILVVYCFFSLVDNDKPWTLSASHLPTHISQYLLILVSKMLN